MKLIRSGAGFWGALNKSRRAVKQELLVVSPFWVIVLVALVTKNDCYRIIYIV